jgi:hypothetical protein
MMLFRLRHYIIDAIIAIFAAAAIIDIDYCRFDITLITLF